MSKCRGTVNTTRWVLHDSKQSPWKSLYLILFALVRHAEEGIPGVSRSAVLSHTDSRNPVSMAPHTDWGFRDWPSEHVTESQTRRSFFRNYATIRALSKPHDSLWQRLCSLSVRNFRLPLLLLLPLLHFLPSGGFQARDAPDCNTQKPPQGGSGV